MPLALTAPGVYIQELPRGSRSITGVSTSLTAFVGAARRGPVETPTIIFSFDEFERRFGGLWTSSPMSQSIRQYFLNGGSEALVVRVINRNAGSGDAAVASSVILPAAQGRLTLGATAEGAAIPGLDHFELTVTPGTTTFTITIAAKDSGNATISDDGGAYSATSAAIDPAAPGMAAAIAATVTAHADPVQMMELVGAPITTVPDAAVVQSYRDAGRHYLTASATESMRIRATAAATGMVGFHHLELRVGNVAGTTFELDVSVIDGSGVTLAHETITGLDVDSGGSGIGPALAASGGGTPLVELVGNAMAELPTAGLYVTEEVATHHDAVLAVGLRLDAADEGAWGNGLQARVDVLDADAGAFHLTLREVDGDGNAVTEEVFHNVTTGSTDTRALDRVLALESKLARVVGTMPAAAAYTTSVVDFHGGEDGLAPRITEDVVGSPSGKTGMHALLDADLFNLLCIPRSGWSIDNPTDVAMWTAATKLCEDARAFLLIDPPDEWNDFAVAQTGASTVQPRSKNAAMYFPRIRAADPLQEGRLATFPPCGVVAGVMARTDVERGVWKAPAGTEATLRGVPELTLKLTDLQQGKLNGLGINCLRTFPVFGTVVWGSRTLDGADVVASQWKHVPVRRLALFLEETLFRSTRWAVFEPNDEPLWAQLRASIGAFMHGLFRQGAFAGTSARQAYFVQCNKHTTTPDDVARGIVNVVVGFAPVQPAEFVIIKLQQLAGERQ